MKIKELNPASTLSLDEKLKGKFAQLRQFLSELERRDLPEEVINKINLEIDKINGQANSTKELKKQLSDSQMNMIKILKSNLEIVPKHYYRTLWIGLGLTLFGVPIGLIIGLSLGNIGLFGIGLPLGIGIGYALGISLDKKARVQGRQINVELK